jgi:hypothetical protein
MRIILAIKSGVLGSLKAWKGVLIYWLISLFLAATVVLPLKAGLKAAYGDSMITDKLKDGIDIDVFGDLGPILHSLISSISVGLFSVILFGIIFYSFISGGIFNALKNGSEKFSSENFFRASGRTFWPYLLISVLLYLITILLLIFIVVIPVSVAVQANSERGGTVIKTLSVSFSVFIIAMSLVLLAADYARAWQTSRLKNDGFKALGFGFRQTFRTFFSSFPLMIIILSLQGLVGWCVLLLMAGFTPVTGKGVFLLLLISQSLFFLKIFIRMVRYGSVTSLMEQYNLDTSPSEKTASENQTEMKDIPV